MEIGDGEAETGGRLETPGWSVHSDRGGCEGVVCWEDEGAPVLAIVVRCIGWAGENIMPSADVSISSAE